MTSEPMKPRRGDEDDSWESLAENLFGIEFSRPDDADELISPDELFAEESEEPASDELEAGSAEDLTRDEATGEGRAGELAEEIDSPEESPVAARGDDEEQYWDALREWAADVSEGGTEESHWTPAKGKRKKKENRAAPERASSGEEAPKEPRDEFAPDEQESEEFLADSDFAAGLLEGEPASKRSRPSRRAEREEEAEGEVARRSADEGESEADRRRPRRRRGRRGRPEEREARRTAPADEDQAEEPFGLEEEEPARGEREREEPRERRERRPRRRRRETAEREERAPQRAPAGEPEEEEEVLVDWNAEPIIDAPPGDGGEDDDEERETVASYRGIPTWEEAIACLLSPSAPEPRSGERESGGRASGRDSGRRRRRRR